MYSTIQEDICFDAVLFSAGEEKKQAFVAAAAATAEKGIFMFTFKYDKLAILNEND